MHALQEIPVAGGYTAIVDDEDFALASSHTWHIQRERHTQYAYTNIPITGKRRGNGKQAYRRISMHRLIMNAARGEVLDHRNRNGLDNRRANIRRCTQSENNANKITWGCSRFKGVSFYKRGKKWAAYIQYHLQRHHLGYFINEEDAAHAYDAKASELFGEYARLNFPDEQPRDIGLK